VSALLAIVGIPVGVAVAGAAGGGTPASTTPTKIAPNGAPIISTGAAAPGSTIGQQLANPTSPVGTRQVPRPRGLSYVQAVQLGTAVSDGSHIPQQSFSEFDAALQQKLAEIESYARAAYENMDQAAKEEGAKLLNDQLKLDPPLKGDESWEEVARRAGDDAGSKIGGLFGGPAGEKLGAIAGAYLGVKLEELISKHKDEVAAWFKSRWSDIESWVSNTAGDVVDEVSEWIGSIF
jgi:hypothetical protein